MKIKFSSIDDFIEELKKDKEKIERGIVRMNCERSATQFSPNVNNLFLRSECIIGSNVIELRYFCGDIWNIGSESDQKTMRNYGAKVKKLEQELAAMGITDIRGGTIEEGEKTSEHR